ncbi:large exoinvolved in heme utilization/adhesion domain protein [Bacillus atrophaeus subsp. globigii]|uniref:Filamentous hemagglutinin outer membrane protein n=1 Tax=Bacillus atrophaeus (strain 1942) TaxID=720555 RepID=A0ABN3Z8Y5_BACA1|nr:filamentous hemagglutinin outer membrane protein [Bacillus atrophaeus 1942]AIK47295.1 large exoinvolved in heme utilization/adhesion domain protein [Bacillus atrophaeus subsp. globigii]AMR64781.1 filamentous hemagglutinin [Bacillus subtilis subsp. globigii]EIM09332.1 filamentous hemagglutinin outer membrane protein [Bacillus atrophaeus C89]KFK81284.1 large exoinvolved in heme utilization/adhesion domain protein [Bacillus atrophaeus]
MAQDIESTHNVKNTPLLKKVIEEEKESVLYKSENGSSKSIMLFGSEGVRVTSKTVWKEKESKARINVENPNPGQRAGQIHYQDSNNTKYLFDPEKGSFIDLNGNIAPKKVNALFKNKEFVK